MRIHFLLTTTLCCIMGAGYVCAAPLWWSNPDYQLIDTSKGENDYAPVLQGQAKQAFVASRHYFDDMFVQFGGAGDEVEALFESGWLAASTYDYNVLLNGQLKSIAHPFYQRLDELNIPLSLIGFGSDYTEKLPWTDNDTSDDNDYAPALIGQVKFVFSFDLNLSRDGDEIPDWWEYVFATDPNVDTDNSTTDSDGDARTDYTEYAEKTDPTDYFDSNLPTLSIVSGGNQEINAGSFIPEPIVVQVNSNAGLLANAPIEISLDPAVSGVIEIEGSLTGSQLSARTNQVGTLSVGYSSAVDYEGDVTVNFIAQSGEHQVSVQAVISVVQQLVFAVFSGPEQTYLVSDEIVFGAGNNRFNQLAGQANAVVAEFAELSGLPAVFVKIVAGGDHTLALTAEGDVYAWGDNFYGQLGLGDFHARSTPKQVASLSNVMDIAAGDGFSSFLVDNGNQTTSVYLSGNLKNGLKSDLDLANLPIESGQTIDAQAIQLSASGRQLLVLCADSSVWGWGQNGLGQINPSAESRYVSEAIQIIDSGIVSIATSPDNSLAITDSGELKVWGNNAFDQLSSGMLDPVSGIYTLSENAVSATLGNGFIAYLKEDDALMTAGLNDSGQLGRDTGSQLVDSAAAVERPVADAISAIASGDRHLVYRTETNQIYGFGDNRLGALGGGLIPKFMLPALLISDLNSEHN